MSKQPTPSVHEEVEHISGSILNGTTGMLSKDIPQEQLRSWKTAVATIIEVLDGKDIEVPKAMDAIKTLAQAITPLVNAKNYFRDVAEQLVKYNVKLVKALISAGGCPYKTCHHGHAKPVLNTDDCQICLIDKIGDLAGAAGASAQ